MQLEWPPLLDCAKLEKWSLAALAGDGVDSEDVSALETQVAFVLKQQRAAPRLAVFAAGPRYPKRPSTRAQRTLA